MKDHLTSSEYRRLIAWMQNQQRQPAIIAFTAGACRDAARAFEEYLDSKLKEQNERIAKRLEEITRP